MAESKQLRTTVWYDGKAYTVRGHNKRELAQNRRKKLAQLERDGIVIDSATTVEKWGMKWLKAHCEPTMGVGSYNNYRGIMNNQIIPVIGSLKLKDVRPIHCQQVLNAQKGRSTSFLGKVRGTLYRMFKSAVRERLIPHNPAEELDLPASTSGSRRAITPEERAHILRLAETHRSGLYIKLMLYCGLRPGECIPLQWCDIDLDTGFLHVTKALKKGSEEVGPPKSESGSRKIPIPDVFLSELRSIYPGDPFAYLITQPTTGKMHTRSSIRSYWNNFLRALDIQMGATVYRNQIIIHAVADDLVPYCLRHTYGTDLQDAGVPINVAKYLMGHSDISVTANIYTSTTDDAIESARQQIDNRVSMSVSMSARKQKVKKA